MQAKIRIANRMVRLGLYVTPLALLVLVIELAFRIVPGLNHFVTFKDTLTVSIRAPNSEYVYKGMDVGSFAEFRTTVRRNAMGFHDRQYEPLKRDGVVRVVILGDSIVEAIQVPLEKNFHELAETRFENQGKLLEIIALGVSDTGPAEAAEVYREFGRDLSPDLVVWALTDVNDVTDSDPELKHRFALQRAGLQWKYGQPPDWILSSVCVSYIWPRLSRIGFSKAKASGFFDGELAELNVLQLFDMVYLANPPPPIKRAYASFEKYTRELVEMVRADDIPFIALSTAGTYGYWLPQRHSKMEWDLEKPERLVREIVQEHDGTFATVKPRFTDLSKQGQRITFPRDGHLNEFGHTQAADVLHAAIEESLARGHRIPDRTQDLIDRDSRRF